MLCLKLVCQFRNERVKLPLVYFESSSLHIFASFSQKILLRCNSCQRMLRQCTALVLVIH